MAFDHQLAGAGDQIGVVQQRALGLEDRRVRRAEPALGVVLQRPQLLAGAAERLMQLRAAFAQRRGAVGHLGLRAGQHMHRRDRQAGPAPMPTMAACASGGVQPLTGAARRWAARSASAFSCRISPSIALRRAARAGSAS